MEPAHHQLCIDACIECARACEHCADACLSAPDAGQRVRCIRLDRDCAIVCWTAAALMARDSSVVEEICHVCADICAACAAECERFPDLHCQRCADACRHCAEECRQMSGMAV